MPDGLSSKVNASSLTFIVLNMFDCCAGKDHEAWTDVQEGGCFTYCCCCTHGMALLHQLSSRWINVITACPLASSLLIWQHSPGPGNSVLCFGVPVCQAFDHISSSPVVGLGLGMDLAIRYTLLVSCWSTLLWLSCLPCCTSDTQETAMNRRNWCSLAF